MQVPPEITQDILLLLPVKSLLRFTTVCKSWRDLILSDRFIDSYKENGRKSAVIVSSLEESRYKRLLRLRMRFPLITKHKVQSLTLGSTLHLKQYNYHVIGHCNGIICLMAKPTTILLWNPALRQCRSLPETSDIPNVYYAGFGYNPRDQDYNVVKTTHKLSHVMIYSLKKDSWKSISTCHLRIMERGVVDFSSDGLFFKGRLYWMRHKLLQPVCWILVFDMAKEEFFEVHLLDTFNERNPVFAYKLGVFRGCISLLTRSRDSGKHSFEIWSMADHCNPDCWTKVFDSSSSMMVALDDGNKTFIRSLGSVNGWPWSTGLTTDGKVFVKLFKNGVSSLLLYDVETQRLSVHTTSKRGKKECRWFAVTDFVETLVSVVPRPIMYGNDKMVSWFDFLKCNHR